MKLDLHNKIALITGSSRGVGRSIAKKLALEGCTVIIHHYNDDINAEETLKEMQKYSNKSTLISGDVRNYDNVLSMAKYVKERFGHIDILVNNAGITKDHTLLKMDIDEEWRDVMSTNLDGAMFCCKAFLPLINDAGRIVNVSSVVAVLGNYGQCAYAASKAGVIGLTLSLAKECAKHRILVNAVLPGFIQTVMLSNIPPDILDRIKSSILLKRLGNPEEVAELVCFLCSAHCSYITGQTLIIDGGLSINSI